jgi:hypothetical protein
MDDINLRNHMTDRAWSVCHIQPCDSVLHELFEGSILPTVRLKPEGPACGNVSNFSSDRVLNVTHWVASLGLPLTGYAIPSLRLVCRQTVRL